MWRTRVVVWDCGEDADGSKRRKYLPHARNLANVGWGRIGELTLLLSKTTYSLVSHDEAGNPSQSILWTLVPAPTIIQPPSHISFVQHSARFG